MLIFYDVRNFTAKHTFENYSKTPRNHSLAESRLYIQVIQHRVPKRQ